MLGQQFSRLTQPMNLLAGHQLIELGAFGPWNDSDHRIASRGRMIGAKHNRLTGFGYLNGSAEHRKRELRVVTITQHGSADESQAGPIARRASLVGRAHKPIPPLRAKQLAVGAALDKNALEGRPIPKIGFTHARPNCSGALIRPGRDPIPPAKRSPLVTA